MAWLNVSLVLPRREAELCVELLSNSGALAVTSEDAGDSPVLEPLPGTNPLWDNVRVCGLFELDASLEAISEELGSGLESEINLEVRFLEAQDWSETWRLHAQSYRFGNSLWVVPTEWQAREGEELAYGGALLRLDPGLAFGTGNHSTTHMCLAWLAKAELRGASMVDYGCGSGILAVAAMLLGAKLVFAVDYDEQALVATANNAQANGMSEKQVVILPVEAMQKRLLTKNVRQMDVVIANILMNPLLELSSRLSDLTRPGGTLVLSGILEEQIETVVAAYTYFDFDIPVIKDGWACLSGLKSDG